MSRDEIIALLIAERDRLHRAIEALRGPIKRRGRPPKNASMASLPKSATPARRKRTFSAAQRKAQGEKMKAYWAAKRKQKG